MIYKVFDNLGKDVTDDKDWLLTPDGVLRYFCFMTGDTIRVEGYTYQICQ
jgi:hypothetical protein